MFPTMGDYTTVSMLRGFSHYGTQVIDIIFSTIAQSVTYYQAAHFGSGDLASEVAYAYGQYQDTWHKQRDQTWKIVYRNLVYMVSHILKPR